jgi:hypothetical protein
MSRRRASFYSSPRNATENILEIFMDSQQPMTCGLVNSFARVTVSNLRFLNRARRRFNSSKGGASKDK